MRKRISLHFTVTNTLNKTALDDHLHILHVAILEITLTLSTHNSLCSSSISIKYLTLHYLIIIDSQTDYGCT